MTVPLTGIAEKLAPTNIDEATEKKNKNLKQGKFVIHKGIYILCTYVLLLYEDRKYKDIT